MNWQPASTIPKDGTVIIVMCLKSVSSPVFWGVCDDEETDEAWYCVDGGCYTEEFTDPLGWLPMPDFPDLIDFYSRVSGLSSPKRDKGAE